YIRGLFQEVRHWASSPATAPKLPPNRGGGQRLMLVLIRRKLLACLLLPKVGLEPTPPCGDQILSLARLPVPPLRPAFSVARPPRRLAHLPADLPAVQRPDRQ